MVGRIEGEVKRKHDIIANQRMGSNTRRTKEEIREAEEREKKASGVLATMNVMCVGSYRADFLVSLLIQSV